VTVATITSLLHDRTLELSDGRKLQPEQRIESFDPTDLERGYAESGVLHIADDEPKASRGKTTPKED
jgi:hypothetical protein